MVLKLGTGTCIHTHQWWLTSAFDIVSEFKYSKRLRINSEWASLLQNYSQSVGTNLQAGSPPPLTDTRERSPGRSGSEKSGARLCVQTGPFHRLGRERMSRELRIPHIPGYIYTPALCLMLSWIPKRRVQIICSCANTFSIGKCLQTA